MTSRPARSLLPLLLALLPLGFLGMFLVAPVVRLLLEGLTSGPLRDHLDLLNDAYLRGKLLWTLSSAALSTLLCLMLALPAGWALARFRFRGRAALEGALLLPFVVPTPVAALGLLALFGPRGLTGLDLQDTALLVILGHLFYNLALNVRLLTAGFRRLDVRTLEAARLLGASPLRRFWRVTLPLLAPALRSAASLTFLYTFGAFGLPLILGGERYGTLEVEIYRLVAFQLELGQAGLLTLLQLGVSGLAVWVYTRLERTQRAGGRERAAIPHHPRSALEHLGLTLALAPVLLISFAPLLAVLARSVAGAGGLSLRFYTGLLDPQDGPPLLELLRNSLTFAAISTLLALGLGLLHALAVWTLERRERPEIHSTRARTAPGSVLDLITLLPLMTSAVAVSVGYLLLYPQWTARLELLLAVYALFGTPLVSRALLPALRALPPSTLEAARLLGLSPLRLTLRLILPILRPAVLSGAALALSSALGEFASTLVLSRPEWGTLTLGVYERLGRPGAQNLGEAFALSSVLLLLTLVCFWVLWRAERRP